MKQLPIIRREYLADNQFLQRIVGSTIPGSAKLQFPFEIPTVETSNEVIIPPATKAVLITTVSVLAAGMIGAAYLRFRSSRKP